MVSLTATVFKKGKSVDADQFTTLKDVEKHYRSKGGSVVVKRIKDVTAAIVIYEGKVAVLSRDNGKVLGND